MPSTVYKGDLAEVSFGHEAGIRLEHDYAGTFRITTVSTDDSANTSIIKLTGGSTKTPVNGGFLKVPLGMIIGAKVSIKGGGSFSADDTTTTGKIYTVVGHTFSGSQTNITLTPKLTTADAVASAAGDALIFHSFGLPNFDVDNASPVAIDSAKTASSESVLTDQFLGLTSALTLPETKVDLKRYHVVGLGRDIAVQAPGRFTNEGGSFEVNMHNPRWLYYCLGMEIVSPPTATAYDALLDTNNNLLNGAVTAGASFLTYDGATPTFKAGSSVVTTGDYVMIGEVSGTAATIDIITYKESTGTNTFGPALSDPASKYIDKAEVREMRRIVGITTTQIWLDEPLSFSHADNTELRFIRFNADTATTGVRINNGGGYSATHTGAMTVDSADATEFFAVGDTVYNSSKQKIGVLTAVGGSTSITIGGGTLIDVADDEHLYNNNKNGSPDRESDGSLTNAVTRLLYSRSTVPSFAMEVSIRRNDTENATPAADIVDGGDADTKQLTRVFRGCKVKDFSLTTDTDAALRLTVNYDAALCYTDTGRLESNPGDRYNIHRMFEDTAASEQGRKQAGVTKGTQKPYMFYNGQITIGGSTVAQVVSFNLSGSTGVTQYYTINGTNTVDAATDQVPFAGSRNPSLAVEGKTEYSMDMEIIVDDPLFYHKVRRAVGHDASVTSGDQIRLSFTKSGTAANRETLDILIDDYVITEAPLPIPEDKGPLRSGMKILPKGIKVIAKDTLLHC
mgnify:CR=1 FL=1